MMKILKTIDVAKEQQIVIIIAVAVASSSVDCWDCV